jgi:hypothetical protein
VVQLGILELGVRWVRFRVMVKISCREDLMDAFGGMVKVNIGLE